MDNNPFKTWQRPFMMTPPSAIPQNRGGNTKVLNPTIPGHPTTPTPSAGELPPRPVLIDLPHHLYIPDGAQSIDITRVCLVLPGTTRESLMSFTAPDGVITNFIQYGVFTDAEFEADVEFRPEVNGSRVYPFHGDPNNNFKIAIGTGPDLSNNSLKSGYLVLQPNNVISWNVTNTSSLAQVMGVRMVGYLLSSQVRTTGRFGG